MTPRRTGACSLAAFLALMVVGCSDAPPEQSVATAAAPQAGPPLELSWTDLMPEGENERLGELYAQYYEDLETDLVENQQQMTSSIGSLADIEEGSELDAMPQLGTFNIVPDLDGQFIRLPGFIVPLEFDGKETVTSFLLVPYYGACIHTPPPPPNQIVFVTGEVPIDIDDLWQAFWIEGELSTKTVMNDIGNAAYSVELTGIEPFNG